MLSLIHILYLACLGLDAGTHFFETVFRPEGALWVALGFAITVVPVVLVAAVAIKWMKIDFGSVAGMLCGSMSNPDVYKRQVGFISERRPCQLFYMIRFYRY